MGGGTTSPEPRWLTGPLAAADGSSSQAGLKTFQAQAERVRSVTVEASDLFWVGCPRRSCRSWTALRLHVQVWGHEAATRAP
jgi:hypothetical protein